MKLDLDVSGINIICMGLDALKERAEQVKIAVIEQARAQQEVRAEKLDRASTGRNED